MTAIGDKRGVLARLRRDRAGNTLAIAAAAMIPIVGFVGAAVDTARVYVVKVRLQQACDAGVLAGRKAMTDTKPNKPLSDDTLAYSQATTFFNNNFKSGWYQNTGVTFTPDKAVDGTGTVANAVTATATATVPMTLMQFFGAAPLPLTVTCKATYDLADTDVVFVLDTTGSMSCYPSDPDTCANSPAVGYNHSDDGTPGYYFPEKPAHTGPDGKPEYSKIESLRQAVVLFDSTMRANADKSTHFRYGFVPYSSSVNIGRELQRASAGYLQTQWTYQSRHLAPVVGPGGVIAGDYATGGATDVSLTGIPRSYCVDQRYPASGFSRTGPSWGDAGYVQAMHYYNLAWSAANSGTCAGKQQPLRPYWRYEPIQYDVTQLLAGASVTTPGRFDGLTSKWRGCVEELNTSAATTFDLDNLPDDLNPDVVPTDPNNLWRPLWPDAEWLRNPGSPSQDQADENVTESTLNDWTDVTYRSGSIFDQGGAANCGMRAMRLTDMTDVANKDVVKNYVYSNDFRAFGGTYHDVGMVWGTRMLSTKGVFKADTAAWAGRNEPSRNIVFMTDGTMAPQPTVYGQYGAEYLDMRVDGSSANWGSYPGYDSARHSARFRIECDAAKKKGITIYVVALGTALTDDLNYCASPGQTFQASNTPALTTAFQTIAQRVAMLRITQ